MNSDKGSTTAPPSNSALAIARAAARDERQSAMVVSDGGLQIRSFADMLEFGRIAVATKLVPRGLDTPEKVALCIQKGAEAGLSVMQSLASIDVIEGQPAWKTKAALAMVRASGRLAIYRSSFSGDGDAYGATVWAKRKDTGEEMSRSFTIGDAKQARLWGKKTRDGHPTPWGLYPKRMLLARANSALLNDLFGDVLQGWTTSEEQYDIAGHEAERSVTPLREENEGGDPLFVELTGEPAQPEAVMPEILAESDGGELEDEWDEEPDAPDSGRMPPIEEPKPSAPGPGTIEAAIRRRAAERYPRLQIRAANRMRRLIVETYGAPELPDGDQLLAALELIRNFDEKVD